MAAIYIRWSVMCPNNRDVSANFPIKGHNVKKLILDISELRQQLSQANSDVVVGIERIKFSSVRVHMVRSVQVYVISSTSRTNMNSNSLMYVRQFLLYA